MRVRMLIILLLAVFAGCMDTTPATFTPPPQALYADMLVEQYEDIQRHLTVLDEELKQKKAHVNIVENA